MPHTRSAKKNLRKIAKRRLHNRTVKKGVKTELKGFQTALDGTDGRIAHPVQDRLQKAG